jgi:signal transduction histidine kinase
MFLGSTTEENSNHHHLEEVTGLIRSGRPQAADSPFHAGAIGAAALWVFAGLLLGLLLGARLDPWIGVPLLVAGTAAGAALLPRAASQSSPVTEQPAVRGNGTTAIGTAMALAVGRVGDPGAALSTMLRLAAESIGSQTALLLSLSDDGSTLRIEAPILLDGTIRDPIDTRTLHRTEWGTLRVALASGVPAAAGRSSNGTTAWDRLADEFGIGSAALVPLTFGESQLGVLAIGTTGESVGGNDLESLGELSAAAGASMGAALRLRDSAETAARSAKTARFRSDYASVVSHELRTPLTTIVGVLKTLVRPELAPESPDARDLLAMAGVQGDRLRSLIEDMLAVSQVDGDSVPIRPELITVLDAIDRAVDAVPGAGALITTRVSPAMPPVILDPEHTHRVLVNLIANAVKYGNESPIAITAAVKGADLVLVVADHGPGLPEETAATAFDPYTQLLRTEVDGRGGVGLGLSIARGLVEAMQGSLSHEPTPGGGATFVIRLPFKPHAGVGH